jgi:hypothetical protein
MTHHELNNWKSAEPFRPFTIVMKDGRRFDVPDAESIFIPPKSEWVYVADGKGQADHIFRKWIAEIEPSTSSRRSSRRRAG